jgi:hypothetical protein
MVNERLLSLYFKQREKRTIPLHSTIRKMVGPMFYDRCMSLVKINILLFLFGKRRRTSLRDSRTRLGLKK